jgi:hypothetical protein
MDVLKQLDGWAITGKMATLMHLRAIGQRGYRIPREYDIAVRRRMLGRVIHLLTENGYVQIDKLKFKKERSYIKLVDNVPINENTVIMIDDYPVMKNVKCESNRHARALNQSTSHKTRGFRESMQEPLGQQ